MSSSQTSSDESYKINSENPGRVFVFTNVNFKDNEIPNLSGAEKDNDKIEEVFKNLKYEINFYTDKTAKEMKAILKNLNKLDYSNYSSVICFINSHGLLDEIMGVDSINIELDKFFDAFKTIKSLENKPKLFFVDACRGTTETTKGPCFSTTKKSKEFSRIAELTDFLFGYSTVKDHVACINDDGSLYIQELCKLIQSNNSRDLINILTDVNASIARTDKQVACFESRLTKRFYFSNTIVNN